DGGSGKGGTGPSSRRPLPLGGSPDPSGRLGLVAADGRLGPNVPDLVGGVLPIRQQRCGSRRPGQFEVLLDQPSQLLQRLGVGPYRHVLPASTGSPASSEGGRMTTRPPAMPLPT